MNVLMLNFRVVFATIVLFGVHGDPDLHVAFPATTTTEGRKSACKLFFGYQSYVYMLRWSFLNLQ